MKLVCQSQKIGEVVVIRCDGRIVVGEEVHALQLEVEKFHLETKQFVLQLAAVAYIDSGGLGALVRLLGTLRAARGDLKLCQLPPFLTQMFEATNLKKVFHLYNTESDAIAAFSQRSFDPLEQLSSSRPRIICIDGSSDLLAYLSALFKRFDYEVYTAKFLVDAATLVRCVHPRLAICGPSTQSNAAAYEKFLHADPRMQILVLPSGFQEKEAGEAGTALMQQVQALLKAPQEK
jgi:anti-anti-sigma factor